MTIHGIDVSSYQAPTWSTSSLSFVFVKAVEGHTVTDSGQGAHAARARSAGLVTGFYAFLRPGDMKAQAAYFVQQCDSVDGDILAADWEDTGVSCGDKDLFLKEVKRLRPTHKTVLYCNLSYWKTRDTTSYCGDGLWIADPNNPAGKPGVTHAWLFQQYSSAGGLDRNVANFASKAALKQWAAGTTPPAPPSPPEPPVATNTQMLTDLTDNLLHIGSLSEKDSKGDPVEHGAGYYLAHTHYDALQLHDQAARIEDGQAALTAKVDALAALVAKLTPQS